MRIANLNGRLAVRVDGGWADVERASAGRFGADPQSVFDVWDDFSGWVAGADIAADTTEVDWTLSGAPVPRPRQVFAIGLNYRDHVAEGPTTVPTSPPVFTKFPSCITGPVATVTLPSDHVDWEAELVVVIGREASDVAVEDAWSYVAGLTAGQDLSERLVQLEGPIPQFSLGKSFAGFGPIGPALVTPDEFADPDDLELGCALGDEVLQSGRTSSMIFSVSELVARLSAVCVLFPGDIIFTGTPSGVGNARNPQRFLGDGDVLTTTIEGIGELSTTLRVG